MVNNAKEDLYARVDQMRKNLGISSYDTTINTLEVCARKISDVEIIYHNFDTSGLCGAAFAGDKENTIVLNNARSEIEQNFDCGHEMLHLVRHRHLNNGIFNCFKQDQNSFLEWEANEGSAQFLVPYQDFIPRFVALLEANTVDIQCRLAEHYRVTEQVINIRLNSLAYEIDQYRSGTSLDCLELLSRRQCKKRGITTSSYLALCDFSLDWNAAIESFEQMPERIHI